jgi:hypothetical protein
MFKWQIAIDRHSPRLTPNQCHFSDPPHFSLLSTFNISGEGTNNREGLQVQNNGGKNTSTAGPTTRDRTGTAGDANNSRETRTGKNTFNKTDVHHSRDVSNSRDVNNYMDSNNSRDANNGRDAHNAGILTIAGAP